MPYLTTRKNLKLQLSPGLVASYDIQPGNGVGLFWYTTHTPDPHGRNSLYMQSSEQTIISATKRLSTYATQLILQSEMVYPRLTTFNY